MITNHQEAAILSCPKYQTSKMIVDNELIVGNENPRGRKYNLQPKPTHNFTNEIQILNK